MLILYDYWRSSAAYRVRIALHLKGLEFESRPVDLRHGQQRGADYLRLNPAGLVPLLVDGALRVSQSLAICAYLDEAWPDTPPLLPPNPRARATIRSMALTLACDTHPLQNLRVLQQLEADFGADDMQRGNWVRHWIHSGLATLERLAADNAGACCHGDTVTLADLCLAPQLYTARRYDLPLDDFPRLVAIDAHLMTLPAFIAAQPVQPGR
ncbi:maleylacetoacetate isomerase [Microvirgula aerodenitrificans]|uniref:maleylacetoacetate isomerase n=1 Tax=Microvirgula aerodenitrificans TaxID=57480 RepID=UPI00248D9632|nr:maleylacetoacetate isomerase [Microvirgula aerodenitrificans]